MSNQNQRQPQTGRAVDSTSIDRAAIGDADPVEPWTVEGYIEAMLSTVTKEAQP